MFRYTKALSLCWDMEDILMLLNVRPLNCSSNLWVLYTLLVWIYPLLYQGWCCDFGLIWAWLCDFDLGLHLALLDKQTIVQWLALQHVLHVDSLMLDRLYGRVHDFFHSWGIFFLLSNDVLVSLLLDSSVCIFIGSNLHRPKLFYMGTRFFVGFL